MTTRGIEGVRLFKSNISAYSGRYTVQGDTVIQDSRFTYLVRPRPRRLNHRRPALNLRCDKLRKRFRIQIAGLDAFGPQPSTHIRQLQYTAHFAVQAINNILRQRRRTLQGGEHRGS